MGCRGICRGGCGKAEGVVGVARNPAGSILTTGGGERALAWVEKDERDEEKEERCQSNECSESEGETCCCCRAIL